MKNVPVDEYVVPDSTKSLQAKAKAAMLQTVSHSFSYSPHQNDKATPAGGAIKVDDGYSPMSARKRNSMRPNYDIVSHANLSPKTSVDKAVLYNPMNQTMNSNAKVSAGRSYLISDFNHRDTGHKFH